MPSSHTSSGDPQPETDAGLDSVVTEPAARPITYRDLLTHTAGLSYGDGDSVVDRYYRHRCDLGWEDVLELSLVELVNRIAKAPLLFHPGAAWRYSYCTDVLGRAIEVMSGMPLDRFMEKALFAPLGMVDTGFWVPPEKQDRFAEVYEVDKNAVPAGGPAAVLSTPTRRFDRPKSSPVRPRLATCVPVTAAAAAAAAAATAAVWRCCRLCPCCCCCR